MGTDKLFEIVRKLVGCSPRTINKYIGGELIEQDNNLYCPYSKWYSSVNNLKCEFLNKGITKFGNVHLYYGCKKSDK